MQEQQQPQQQQQNYDNEEEQNIYCCLILHFNFSIKKKTKKVIHLSFSRFRFRSLLNA